MKALEYKHVRMKYGFRSCFSQGAFDEQLSGLLRQMGDEGWELKACLHEGVGCLHVHLIFARQRDAA